MGMVSYVYTYVKKYQIVHLNKCSLLCVKIPQWSWKTNNDNGLWSTEKAEVHESKLIQINEWVENLIQKWLFIKFESISPQNNYKEKTNNFKWGSEVDNHHNEGISVNIACKEISKNCAPPDRMQWEE